MAKRILTLDYLRGFAIIMVFIFHMILTAWDLAIGVRDGDIDPFTLGIGYVILMLLVLLFGYWRGFFLIISSMVHFYVMTNSYKRGAKQGKIILKQVLTGIVLLIWGSIVELLFNEWGLAARWAAGGGPDILIKDIYNAEAIVNIAWAIIISSSIYALLTLNGGVKKTTRNIIIFAILAVVVLIITPSIHTIANSAYGGNFQDWGSLPPGENEFSITRLLVAMFVHAESPTLPALAYSFAGCAFGILFSSEKVSKKTLRWGYLVSFIIFVVGAILTALKVMNTLSNGGDLLAVLDVHVHPYWFLLLMMGMQLLVLMLCFNLIEFNRNANLAKAVKATQYFRRWGVLSLTLYSFGVMQYLVRFLLNFLTPLDLLAQGGADTTWIIIIIAEDILLWTAILWAWEKGKFRGSLEWLLLYLAKIGKEKNPKDPLNIRGVLYNVEPIVFVDMKKAQELAYFRQGKGTIETKNIEEKHIEPASEEITQELPE